MPTSYAGRGGTAPFLGLIIASVGVFLFYQSTNQVMIQRVLSARSTWEGMMGIVFAGFINLVRPLVTCLLGLFWRGTSYAGAIAGLAGGLLIQIVLALASWASGSNDRAAHCLALCSRGSLRLPPDRRFRPACRQEKSLFCAAANSAIALRFQSLRPVRRVAELGSLAGAFAIPTFDTAMTEIPATPEEYTAEPVRFPPLHVVDLSLESAAVHDDYRNQVLLNTNDHCLRLAVITGSYPWHVHPGSDELFLVLEGRLVIELANGNQLSLGPGQTATVPAGTQHRTRGEGRTVNLCFEAHAAQTVFVPAPGGSEPGRAS